ncbi:MAG: hypothetical protein IT182_10650 [Acidobacteria bacterium]|nr:hypothetical protein [Acidobacteriota bacterium]
MTTAATALLAHSRTLVDSDDWALAYWWGRGAAVLARQAIELSLDEFWMRRARSMVDASARGQFLALRLYVDVGAASEGYVTWCLLSRACHHHPYELQPTREEVVRWIEATERFLGVLRSAGHDLA